MLLVVLSRRDNARLRLVGSRTRLVLEDDVHGVDDAGDVSQDGQGDVDEEVDAAAALEEDTQGREDDGEDDLADVAGIVSGPYLTLTASAALNDRARSRLIS